MGLLYVLRRACKQTLAYSAPGHHLPQGYRRGWAGTLRGLWMARGELFLADELMPQVETTGGLPDPQLSFNNPQRALLYN